MLQPLRVAETMFSNQCANEGSNAEGPEMMVYSTIRTPTTPHSTIDSPGNFAHPIRRSGSGNTEVEVYWHSL